MAIEYHCDEPIASAVVLSTEGQLAKAARGDAIGTYFKVVGSYDNDVVWRASGVREAPIYIDCSEAKMKKMVFEVEGDWVRITGGDWRAAQVTLEGSYNRVCRAHFHDGKPGGNSARFNSAVLITGTASYNRVDHCLVERWKGRAIRQARAKSGARDNLMDHNHMRDMSDGSNRNGREAMQIGSGPAEQKAEPFNTHLVFNLIEDFDMESEAISIKANGNTIMGNTLVDCRVSYIVCRSGSRNLFAGNYMHETRGMIIFGDHNHIIDNVVTGRNSRAEIGIRSGDCNVDQLKAGLYPGGHPCARNTIVVGNRCSIGEQHQVGEWGRGKNEYYDEQWLPALTTQRFDNVGALKTEGRTFKSQGTIELSEYNGMRYKADMLTKADVGLHAPDPYCKDNGGDPDDLIKAYEASARTLAAHREAHVALGNVIWPALEE